LGSLIVLAQFSYIHALIIWAVFSFILGIIGAFIVIYYAFSSSFLKKNRVYVWLFYFAFFPSVINIISLQFGSILLFFIMLGYYFYLNNRHYLAGLCWGIIIAVKLFPALLFCYVVQQKRFKVFWTMLFTLVIAFLIPLWMYGPIIYKQYYAMMKGVLWYGDNWNASIYGFLFRLFVDTKYLNLIEGKLLYVFLFLLLFLGYVRTLGPKENNPPNHQPFCLTLVMMLLMSPLGWAYYFPLLIFPLALTWFVVLEQREFTIKPLLIWFFSLFLINFPLDYVHTEKMTHFFARITFYSSYFFGLLLLTYLVGKEQKIYGNNDLKITNWHHDLMPVLCIILFFGLAIPAGFFALRAFKLYFI
jgi:hypothetical protein